MMYACKPQHIVIACVVFQIYVQVHRPLQFTDNLFGHGLSKSHALLQGKAGRAENTELAPLPLRLTGDPKCPGFDEVRDKKHMTPDTLPLRPTEDLPKDSPADELWDTNGITTIPLQNYIPAMQGQTRPASTKLSPFEVCCMCTINM